MRAHYTRPVTDQQGDLLPNVQITVYEPGTTTPVSDVLYFTDTGDNILSNPFVSDTGIIDLYLNEPKRVRFGIVQGNLPVQYYEDVDVLAAGSDSQHSGAGVDSLVIGSGATAAGNNSVALGQGANSPGAQSVAVGQAASSLGTGSVAVGSAAVQGVSAVGVGDQAQATGDTSVAIGQGAQTTMADGVALGHGASAPYAHSTAVGPGAITTGPNQIMMGTATDVTEIPVGSAIAMTSPGGSRYLITVDDDGSLVTTLA